MLNFKSLKSIWTLRPNCLLTRYPIVMINQSSQLKQRFLFWFMSLRLKAHGYQVFHQTQQSPGKAHIWILGARNIETSPDCISITMIEHIIQPWPHYKITINSLASLIDPIIDHAILLAESDFQCSH